MPTKNGWDARTVRRLFPGCSQQSIAAKHDGGLFGAFNNETTLPFDLSGKWICVLTVSGKGNHDGQENTLSA